MDRPYILYGYSLGALIAFELARELRKRKIRAPLSLYALARRAPHLPQHHAPLHHLPDDLFLAEVVRRYGGLPAIIQQDVELMKLVIPVLRADITALETYVYEEQDPLDCSIYASGGNLDSTVEEKELEAWRLHTSSGFELKMFDGDHFFIRNNRESIFRSILAQIPILAAANG